MSLAVLSLFAAAVAAPWLFARVRRRAGWLLAILPFALFLGFAIEVRSIARYGVLIEGYRWLPQLGVNFSFMLDGLGILFALIITFIGALVLIYTGDYMNDHPETGRLFMLLLAFMGSMLGIVLANNLITLFVFWELTSITSYLLIGFDHERERSRKSALQALLVTAGGGLALLAGFLFIGQAAGTLELSQLLAGGVEWREHVFYVPILVLLAIGAFTKSAIFPFSFWLPNAMEAPTPVSAYLHSATMVKAGIYLLFRFHPLFGGTVLWELLLALCGGVTMFVAALWALKETDLKRILAYSTVSMLGTFTVLLGVGSQGALIAALAAVLAHALYKGALFLVTGAVDHETGTREIHQLGGLHRDMPWIATAGVLASLSMAGLPPLFGFVGKELLLETSLQEGGAIPALQGASVGASMFTVAVALMVGVGPFFGKRPEACGPVHDPPLGMRIGPAVLGALGVMFGAAAYFVGDLLIRPAAIVSGGQQFEVHLGLWHGFSPVLLVSLAVLLTGAALYLLRRAVRRVLAPAHYLERIGPGASYDWLLKLLNWTARAHTRVMQSGYLSVYLLITIGTTAGLVLYTLATRRGWPQVGALVSVQPYEAVIVALMIGGALIAVFSFSRLAAVAGAGVVGIGVALFYLIFGAPDLAITQFLVEILTLVLLVLVLYHLPRFSHYSTRPIHARDAVVAIAGGGMMTALVLTATSINQSKRVAEYYAESAVRVGQGRNIVNVILVDFRALDTMGEITVLAIAALGVVALLKLRPAKGEQE